jgi:adenylate cyclase
VYPPLVTGERMTEARLAEASGLTPEFIRRLVELQIIPRRDGDHPYRAADIQRVRLAQAFDGSEIPLEAIGAAVASGHLSFEFVDTMFPDPPALTGRTFRDVAAELGIPLDMVTRLYAMWGLPRPDPDDVVREDDMTVFTGWATLLPQGTLNERVLVQGARLFGDSTRRLADWGMDFFRTHIEGPALASGMSRQQVMDAASAFAAVGVPIMERELEWLLRRQLEHHTIQHVIEYVEAAIEAAGVTLSGAVKQPAVAFLDLTGYTALTEELGDEAAAEQAATLAATVQERSNAYGAQVVKLLGDGAMFLFPDPGPAVVCCLEIVEDVGKAGLPPARVGMAAGPVVFRDGDYFGRTVNVAARVADFARSREVLATAEVVAASDRESVHFDELGPVTLKGVSTPITLSLASRAR